MAVPSVCQRTGSPVQTHRSCTLFSILPLTPLMYLNTEVWLCKFLGRGQWFPWLSFLSNKDKSGEGNWEQHANSWQLYNTPSLLFDLNIVPWLLGLNTLTSWCFPVIPVLCRPPSLCSFICAPSQKEKHERKSSSCEVPCFLDQHRWWEQSGSVLQECEVWEDTAAVAWEAETPATGPCRHLTPRRPLTVCYF